ncbi:uncharacterized protein LOC110689507 [Chenopodium quinoa]|uniref:uncharacterized protein LOC110689507 n=1 Tax=Chenopodium quinoa TaxID=63459 RepID=UPI000B78ED8D|nr:uncharacterized protein LOC110689507 [Chenopodium quinoa]
MVDCQYGIPYLSSKSCSRANRAEQRSSHVAVHSQEQNGQPSCVRVSKRNRLLSGSPEVHLDRTELHCDPLAYGGDGHPESLSDNRGSKTLPRERATKKKRSIDDMAQSQQKRYLFLVTGVTVIPAAMSGQPLSTKPLKLSSPMQCLKCGAKKFAFETVNFCCSGGEVKIAANEYPAEQQRLFTSNDEDAVHFKTYARLYNNLFAFSSIGGKFDASTYKGIYVFKMHGQMYHFVLDLLPYKGTPKYLQLYFYDGQNEANNRLKCFPKVRRKVIDILMRISEQNPYAVFFRSLRERHITVDTKIVLNQSTVLDQRVYNAPAVDDVAVIWPDNASSSQSLSPHILVAGRSATSHRIYHNYGCYDPLQYPLLFPRGECGWTQGLQKQSHGGVRNTTPLPDPIMSCAVHSAEDLLNEEDKRASKKNTRADKFISAREYYAYKLQIRPENMLLRAGRYCGETVAHNVGRRVILPPTFIGGPRDMKKRYLNAMALVQRYGKPDLFVTITCNANWPEIKAELAPGETAQDRPDLVARIFRAKLLLLKKEILGKQIFGEVAALVYVIEFQKRGLPHAHFLIILKSDWKMKCPADYDKYVCAEIPPVSNSNLRRTVLAHMMHGPCGVLNPECPCMRNKGGILSCKSKYPKQFSNETTNNKDGYPIYQRRDTGEQVKIRNTYLDNQWVIPYNPYLSSLFDCHLNVEVCSTIKAVKYLYKYVYKGHDRVSFNVVPGENNSVDEINQF